MKQKLEKLKKQGIWLAMLFAGLSILTELLFYKSGIWTNLKIVASLFWFYIIPGYAFLALFFEFDLLENVVIGGVVGMALTTITAYYLNLLGINLRQLIMLPLGIVLLLFAIFYLTRRFRKYEKQPEPAIQAQEGSKSSNKV